jgi:putative copper export protein
MKQHILLILHLFAATIWIGGHLVLCIGYMPRALRQKDPAIITNFEKSYEKIGLPALLLLVITGVLLSYSYDVTVNDWFSFNASIEKVISTKLILLLCTLTLAIHARIFIIPKLNPKNLTLMGIHVILITLIGITMMVLGTFVRFGGF